MITKSILANIKKVKSSGIIYSLNREGNTAGIVGYQSSNDEILIHFSVTHDKKEYIITDISEGAFKYCEHIKSIQFAANSNLRKISKHAFFNSNIEFISIPSSTVDLDKGWCAGTPKLIKFEVMLNNPKYSIYGNKFIIGKSSFEKANFDLLVFSARDIETAVIPSFIEKIEPFSFNECKEKIKRFEFPENSKLETIENSAFYLSSIERVSFPESLTKIEQLSFYSCRKLRIVDIPKNSKLQFIGKSAFYDSAIESISIPASLVMIGEYSFYF